MNVPGRTEGNWRWCCTEEMRNGQAFEWVRNLTNASNRFEATGTPSTQKVLEVRLR